MALAPQERIALLVLFLAIGLLYGSDDPGWIESLFRSPGPAMTSGTRIEGS